MTTIRVDDATFDDGERQFVWRSHGEAQATFMDGGSDEGAVAVRIDVDGQMDIVYGIELGPSGDVASLDRAIAALQRVRDGLADLYGGQGDPGRCWEQGDTGRCHSRLGHEAAHAFPSAQNAHVPPHITTGGLEAAS